MSGQPLTLTAAQRRRLRRQLHQTPDARVYRRTLALLEVGQGKPVADVARTLQVARRTVYYWVEAYAQGHDPAALIDAPRPGRPSLWTEEARSLLCELLAGPPDRRGYFAANWTVPLLREELRHGTGARFSDDTLRRELHRLGYAWKRPRYVLAPDPEEEKKTPHPPPNSRLATAQRRAGRGRD
jgi:transposase